jgi:hypothetical protein
VDNQFYEGGYERIRPSIILGVFLLATYTASADEYQHVTRGTLITAMGNKQGIVLMTDSMVTYTDATSLVEFGDSRDTLAKD